MPNSFSSPDPCAIDFSFHGERPDLEALYAEGQDRSYRRHPGSSAALPGAHSAADCVIVARSEDGRAHAGMRIHLYEPGVPLPVEAALGGLCAIGEALAAAPRPLVELCGTWVDKPYRESGLASEVISASLAATRLLGARRVVGCSHQYSLPLYLRFGAQVDPSLGVHAYPDDRYQTCVVWSDPGLCGEGQAMVEAAAARLGADEPDRGWARRLPSPSSPE